MSTNELMKIALAGLLWCTAVYMAIDVNLRLHKNPASVPVSGLFMKFHTLPCRVELGLESMPFWGRRGLPGLFDAYMGIESWHNRLTWALISYGTHELFLAMKLRKSGDIELNPGPNPSQPEKYQEKTPLGRGGRRNTRRAKEEVRNPQYRAQGAQGQSGDTQQGPPVTRSATSTMGTHVAGTSDTSVSRLHLTPDAGSKEERYRTPISKELEEAKEAADKEPEQETLESQEEPIVYEDYEGSEPATSTPKKDKEVTNVPTESTPSGNNLSKVAESEGNGGSKGPEGIDEEEAIENTLNPEEEASDYKDDKDYRQQGTTHRQPTHPSGEGLFTSVRESPDKVSDRSNSQDDVSKVTTTPPSMGSTTVHRARTEGGGGGTEHKKKKANNGSMNDTLFTKFPGHTCEYDERKKTQPTNHGRGHAEGYTPEENDNNNGGVDVPVPVHVAQSRSSVEDDEEVFINTKNFPNMSATAGNPRQNNSPVGGTGHGSSGDTDNTKVYNQDNHGSTWTTSMDGVEGSVNEGERRRERREGGGRVSSRVHDSVDGSIREQDRGACWIPPDNSQTGSSQRYSPTSHAHNTQAHQHAHARNHGFSQGYSHNRSHTHGHPQYPHGSPQFPYNNSQPQHGHYSQRPRSQHHPAYQTYQQPQATHPSYSSRGGGGGVEERNQVSHGYLHRESHSYGTTNAMNEYYNQWRGAQTEKNDQQDTMMANAVSMILSKMESQQDNLQRQLQANQAVTDRGIESTQKKISHMHRDIHNIQQEMRETNLEVQQNKEEIKVLQDRQNKLEAEQDSALAKTQMELQKAQDEIKQMKQSIEDLDEAIDARDEEIEEIQDELMEARQNLNRVEAHNRRGNLKIYGMPEYKGSDKEKCDEVAIKLFNEYMPGQEWGVDQVEKAHRLGKFQEGGRARPILVKMSNPQDTFLILGNRKAREKMKENNLHISQDLTRDQQDILKQERDKGNLAYFVSGKLVIREGEGKFPSRDRDSSRGRRRDRGSIRDHDRDSASSNSRNKRDRHGGTIPRDLSRAESGSRTRYNQRLNQGSPTKSPRPWRFGSGHQSISTSRERRGSAADDKAAEKDDNQFKIPKGPAYRSARPAYRNPYNYMSRSTSRHSRNSSPPNRGKNSAQGSKQASGQNSRATSPANSPPNSPSTSQTGSRQSSKNSSKHSSRGSSPQHTTSKTRDNKESDAQSQQQQQQEELGERLKQLSEESPSKHKHAIWTPSRPKETSTKAKSIETLKQSGQVLPTTPKKAFETTTELLSGKQVDTGKLETPGNKASDSEASSPESHPPKRQKLTNRRFGSGTSLEELPHPKSNPGVNSAPLIEGSNSTTRPRARVYSRRFRRPFQGKPIPSKDTHGKSPQAWSSTGGIQNSQAQKLDSWKKDPVHRKTGENQGQHKKKFPELENPAQVKSKMGNEEVNKAKVQPGSSTERVSQAGKEMTEKQGDSSSNNNSSPTQEEMEMSPTQSNVSVIELNSPQSPMEIESPLATKGNSQSPKTPEEPRPDQYSKNKKQGSWGEQERTKNMRSSLEKDNAASYKQGGAIKWRLVEDETVLQYKQQKDNKPKSNTPNKEKVNKDPKEPPTKVQTQEKKKDDGTYTSIWDPPHKRNLSKEGCSTEMDPGQENPPKATNNPDNKIARGDAANNTKTAPTQVGETEEGWENVRYKKTCRREKKQLDNSGSGVISPKPDQLQQERGRERTKKRTSNSKRSTVQEQNTQAGAKATSQGKESERNSLLQKPQERGSERLSLQERVNIALATAASKEDKRNLSTSRQAYLTPEGTVVRQLQGSTNRPTGTGQAKSATQEKNDKKDSTRTPRGNTNSKQQQKQ